MKTLLFLVSLTLVSAADVPVEDFRTFPGALFLPTVLLPYAAAVTAVVIPLAKTFLVHALKVLNLPFEVLVVLYLVFYAMVFAFPGVASLLTVTGTLSARSLEDSSSFGAAGMSAWLQSILPSWTSELSATTLETSTTTTPLWSSLDTRTTSTTLPTLTSSTTAPASRSSSAEEVRTPSPVCSSYRVCVSVAKLVKDYPVSVMLMTYLGDYLQGLQYERPVREGMAGMDCSLAYPGCRE
ncbi:hypothetical protein IscW_ISCW020405 [Ixodes scapularis]|uniref:Uncharacterized protein n=1 Tax=Ixodes scapularis TaxID=6945 RepID=B7PZA1_IXOSC|nr:hypothetical protein IscW_ISCW020405 [Ixodes scapularis]|eukprot:XP_002405038.1 hypothetical protein IscW_ISCW020405 [Ixodes scapularis]